MAEGFYNEKSGKKSAISAGLVDSSQKYNGHPRNDVVQVMQEAGIDISDQKIKQLTTEMIDVAKKIVVLCDKKMCPATITKRANVIYSNIEDPPDEEKTIEIIRSMRDKIKLVVENLQ